MPSQTSPLFQVPSIALDALDVIGPQSSTIAVAAPWAEGLDHVGGLAEGLDAALSRPASGRSSRCAG
jgi:hypothetical protein